MTFNGKQVFVVDVESDGLLDTITKLYILGYSYEADGEWVTGTTQSYEDIKRLVENPDIVLVGHNFIQFDKPAIKKVIPNINWKASVIDTLLLSFTLQDQRLKHSVQSYAEEYGMSKVVVEDHEWQEGNIPLMIDRVTKDCELQTKIFLDQISLLQELYGDDEATKVKYINYLNFMAEVYVEQADNPFTLDVEQAEKNKAYLEAEIEKRVEKLAEHMPKIPIKKVKNKPKKCYKDNGELSNLGEKWFEFLEAVGLPKIHQDPVAYIGGYKDPNPQSIAQQKEYLFSLGWEPCTFSDSISVDGIVNKVPQLKDKDKNLVKSITKMIPSNPHLKELEDLSIIQHRLGYVKAFLDTQVNGKVKAGMGKITVSTRIGHRKPIVNLPSISAPYGEYVRSLLTCDEGYTLCGSDISSLENYVAANYTYKYNPIILEQLNDPDFDTHTTMAVFAGLMTKEEQQYYKDNKNSHDPDVQKKVAKLHKIRYDAKTTNYSALFGIGATKLAEDLGTTRSKAKKLIDGFWSMNEHIARFRDEDLPLVTTSGGRQWVKAPLTGFYLACRADHKKFNIVIQSTGSYIHNLWMGFIRKAGYKMTLSMHDEYCAIIPDNEEEKEKIKTVTVEAMDKVNKLFNLAAPISVDVQFNSRYSGIH